jgi:Protein of unknown function (DUF2480)
MFMTGEIINRVAQSELLTFDLADLHDKGPRAIVDLKGRLFMGQILREKDLREWVKAEDWSQYQGKHVLITCSVDAIIPAWAYMLLATVLEPFASTLVFGTVQDLETKLFMDALDKTDFAQFEGKKVVVKGCGDIEIPTSVYVDLTRRLRPYASKIMYGEPCSTVPLYKKTS